MGLEELKGIGKEKEKIGPDKWKAAELKEIEAKIIKDFLGSVDMTTEPFVTMFENNLYNQPSNQHNIPDFDEYDLNDYLLITSEEKEDIRPVLKGVFSGYLLSTLTERMRKKSKTKTLHFDGHGKKFDYLFSYAKRFDSIIINNFEGFELCSECSEIQRGYSDSVVLVNCKGSLMGYGLGMTNNVGLLGFINCEGPSIGAIAAKNGSIDTLFAAGCDSAALLHGSCYKGQIEVLFSAKNHSEGLLNNAFEQGGKVNIFDIYDQKKNFRDESFSLGKRGNINHLLIETDPRMINAYAFRKFGTNPHRTKIYIGKEKHLVNFNELHWMVYENLRKARDISEFKSNPSWPYLSKLKSLSDEISERKLDSFEMASKLVQIYQENKRRKG